jgi:hypothetical protein
MMIRPLVLFTLLTFLDITATAQDRYVMTTVVGGGVDGTMSIDLGGGNTFHATGVHYPDSHFVELFWTDTDQVVMNARAYRLYGDFMLFADGAALDSGFVLCGTIVNQGPFLLMVDSVGDTLWYKKFTSPPFTAQWFSSVLGRNNEFTAYTGKMQRLSGNTLGTGFTGVEVTPLSTSLFLVAGAAKNGPMDMAYGYASSIIDPDNQKMMLARLGSGGAVWLKLFDMEPLSYVNEFARDAEVLSDGATLLMGSSWNANITAGYIAKVDTTGDLLWCRRYSSPIPMGLNSAIELPGGDLLVAGQRSTTSILLRLDTDGLIVWEGELPFYVQASDIIRTDQGTIVITGPASRTELDSMGNACDLVYTTLVTSAPHVPAISPVSVTNSTIAVTDSASVAETRAPVLGWVPDCIGMGAQEQVRPSLTLYPNPTDGWVHLGTPGQVNTSERVVLTDAWGRTVLDVTYGAGVDLRDLPAGIYGLVLPTRAMRLKLVRR